MVDLDPKFDPRVEHLPLPPTVGAAADPIQPASDSETWESIFQAQVKQCGEVLQCHTCRAVCHKYGNEGTCRFLFPHEFFF